VNAFPYTWTYLVQPPALPAWALTKATPVKPAPANGTSPVKIPEPKTGAELSAWLDQLDAWLVDHGHGQKGWLRAECIRLSGETKPIQEWPLTSVAGVALLARGLVAKLRQGAPRRA
jgi:hypothetical protein